MRRAIALLLSTVIAGFALLLGAGQAAAHDSLLSSDPAQDAALVTAPDRISLTFSGVVGAGFSTVTVTGPDGAQWQDGAASEDGRIVNVALRPLGPAGEYVIGYRVVSSDGHPIEGRVPFRLTQPGPTAPAPPAAQSSTAPETEPSGEAEGEAEGAQDTAAAVEPTAQDGGTPVWPFVVGAVVLLGVGAVVALRVGRTS